MACVWGLCAIWEVRRNDSWNYAIRRSFADNMALFFFLVEIIAFIASMTLLIAGCLFVFRRKLRISILGAISLFAGLVHSIWAGWFYYYLANYVGTFPIQSMRRIDELMMVAMAYYLTGCIALFSNRHYREITERRIHVVE